MSRPTRDYNEFPEEYAGLLVLYKQTGTARLGPFTIRDARTAARDINRYRTALRAATVADPSNEHASKLADIAAEITVRCYSNARTSPDDWYVELVTSPVVAAVRDVRRANESA